jgi:hypothetical protein
MATVYFFNGTQSGTADGSYADPYDLSSLATQESSSSAGDIFIFKDGTYSLSADQTFSGGAGISYQAESDRGVIFDADSNHFVFGVANGTGATVDFSLSGFDFIDFINGASHAFLIQMDISNTVTFNRCLIENQQSTAQGGVIGKDATGEHLNAVFNETVIVVKTTGSSSKAFRDRNGTTANLASLSLINSTVYYEGGSSSTVMERTGTTVIKNTILYGGNANATLGTSSVFLTESSNCYYNIGESADVANAIIVADPQFVDSATGDYRLRPSSPCIGAGTAS